MKVNITDDALRALVKQQETCGKKQLFVFDTKQPGFGVIVGGRTTTFIVRHRVGATVHHESLGHWKGRGGAMGVQDARSAARKIVGKLEGKEATPGSAKRASKLGPTLAEATALYVTEMERTDCRPTSIASVKREIGDEKTSYLKSWLDRPLGAITGKECRERHAELAKSASGAHVANRVMRELRAIWNYVAKEAAAGTIDGLPLGHVFPANPTIAVQWVRESSKNSYTERRGEPVKDDDLPAWHAAVLALTGGSGRPDGKKRDPRGTRRDYNLIVILTGLRRSDAASLRWEHINLTDEPIESRVYHSGTAKWEPIILPPRCILRPSPKGGADRAFALPLSHQALEVLARRRETVTTADNGWVFPTTALVSDKEREANSKAPCYLCRDLGMPAHEKGATIHITEPKEESTALVSPHRLRDTYASVLGKLQPAVNARAIKLLMNHSLDRGDVTEGYMAIDIEPLREPQQRVADYLAEHWKPRKPKLRVVTETAA